jgi:hypothetical protein
MREMRRERGSQSISQLSTPRLAQVSVDCFSPESLWCCLALAYLKVVSLSDLPDLGWNLGACA